MEFAVCPVSDVRDGRPLRGAVRYPLHLQLPCLPMALISEAMTEDLSASGVLLRLQQPLQEGETIEFLLEIPAGALNFSATAAVQCSGKVIRSYWENGQPFAAAVIDDYRFQ